jgi:hypothetical protein
MGIDAAGLTYTKVEYPYRNGKVTINGWTLELDLLTYTTYSEPLRTLYIKGEKMTVLSLDV